MCRPGSTHQSGCQRPPHPRARVAHRIGTAWGGTSAVRCVSTAWGGTSAVRCVSMAWGGASARLPSRGKRNTVVLRVNQRHREVHTPHGGSDRQTTKENKRNALLVCACHPWRRVRRMRLVGEIGGEGGGGGLGGGGVGGGGLGGGGLGGGGVGGGAGSEAAGLEAAA